MADKDLLSIADQSVDSAAKLGNKKDLLAREEKLEGHIAHFYSNAKVKDGKYDTDAVTDAPFTGSTNEKILKVHELEASLHGVRKVISVMQEKEDRDARDLDAQARGVVGEDDDSRIRYHGRTPAFAVKSLGDYAVEAVKDGRLNMPGSPSGGGFVVSGDAAGRILAKVTRSATGNDRGWEPDDPRSGEYVSYGRDLDSIGRVLRTRVLDGKFFVWMERERKPEGTAQRAEGAGAAESSYSAQQRKLETKISSTYITLTREVLEDTAQLRSIVNEELMEDGMEHFYEQIVTGNGTGENILGINAYTAAAQKTKAATDAASDATRVGTRAVNNNTLLQIPAYYVDGATRSNAESRRNTLDAYVRASAEIRKRTRLRADYVAMSAYSWANLATTRDSDNRLQSEVTPMRAPNGDALTFIPNAALRVVFEEHFPAGEQLVFSSRAMMLGIRRNFSITPGMINDDLIRNQVTYFLNMQGLLAVTYSHGCVKLVNAA